MVPKDVGLPHEKWLVTEVEIVAADYDLMVGLKLGGAVVLIDGKVCGKFPAGVGNGSIQSVDCLNGHGIFGSEVRVELSGLKQLTFKRIKVYGFHL